MAGLFTTLNSSSMALNAHSRAIETTGKNLANVNNPNYARQRVVYGDRGTVETPEGAQSLGLEVLAIQQVRDILLDRQVGREISLSGSFEAQQEALERALAGLGQGIDGSSVISATGSTAGGLGAAIDDFFNAFQNLASRPTDAGARQTLLQKATILTDSMREADTRLAQVQSDIDTGINVDVNDANRLINTIADLNAQISRFEVSKPGSAVDLRDQRQARLEELAKLIPVQVRELGNGGVQLVAKDAGNADVMLLDGITVNGSLAFTGTGFTGGASATALVLGSGSMQGALIARDGAVQDLRDNLDAFAGQMVTSVNGAYNPSATAGSDFFDPAGVTAGTIALRSGLNASTLIAGTGAAGDNTLAVAVAALATTAFSTGSGDAFDGTFSQFYSRSVSDLGQALATATSRANDQDKIQQLVRNQRDTVSGVSMDEEMADLVKFQRAFQASSRVFSVVDELLDTVVNRLGA
jgi:flagellar hook-associated protein 1 FlgK